jgi:hypothetical protein
MDANAPALSPTDAVSGLPMRWPTMRERSCMSAQLVSPAASNEQSSVKSYSRSALPHRTLRKAGQKVLPKADFAELWSQASVEILLSAKPAKPAKPPRRTDFCGFCGFRRRGCDVNFAHALGSVSISLGRPVAGLFVTIESACGYSAANRFTSSGMKPWRSRKSRSVTAPL